MPNVAPFSSHETSPAPAGLTPKLKELQGSFAIEGIEIPDDRLLQYAAEFEEAKKQGRVRAEIEAAIRRFSDR